MQLWDQIDVGYATRIAKHEAGTACNNCANKFSTNEKVYRMHCKDGQIIQCTSLACFKDQGGKIDEYQINTVIAPKPADVKTVTPHNPGDDKILEICDATYHIEKLLSEKRPNIFAGTHDSKLGMYVKIVQCVINGQEVMG